MNARDIALLDVVETTDGLRWVAHVDHAKQRVGLVRDVHNPGRVDYHPASEVERKGGRLVLGWGLS